MTRVTLICRTCGKTARRDLALSPGCRGVFETPSLGALCPAGHGPMVRRDVPPPDPRGVFGRHRFDPEAFGMQWRRT